MILHLRDGDRTYLLRHETREPFVYSHAQRADALRAKSKGRGQYQVGSVRFQQICRADVGLKPFGDQGNNVHEGFSRLAALGRQISNFFQRQNVIGIQRCVFRLAHIMDFSRLFRCTHGIA